MIELLVEMIKDLDIKIEAIQLFKEYNVAQTKPYVDLWVLLKSKDTQIFQRSWSMWLKERDTNIGYFYSCVRLVNLALLGKRHWRAISRKIFLWKTWSIFLLWHSILVRVMVIPTPFMSGKWRRFWVGADGKCMLELTKTIMTT